MTLLSAFAPPRRRRREGRLQISDWYYGFRARRRRPCSLYRPIWKSASKIRPRRLSFGKFGARSGNIIARDAYPVFAARLDPVHRLVGRLDQRLSRVGGVGQRGNADRSREVDAQAVVLEEGVCGQ